MTPTSFSFQLCHLDRFLSLLSVGDRRTDLHRLFQALVDAGRDLHAPLCEQALKALAASTDGTNAYYSNSSGNVNRAHRLLLDCANMASFYTDAGWYDSAGAIYARLIARVDEMLLLLATTDDGTEAATATSEQLLDPARVALMAVKAEASAKLLSSLSAFCKFTKAAVRRDFSTCSFLFSMRSLLQNRACTPSWSLGCPPISPRRFGRE